MLMEVKKVIFYFLWILGLLLMFMDFMLIGLALFLFTPFIFSPGKMKKNEKWEQFNKNKIVKVVKTTIAVIILLIIVVLFFVNPKLNLIIPLFFIAVMFTPPKKRGHYSDSDYDDFT